MFTGEGPFRIGSQKCLRLKKSLSPAYKKYVISSRGIIFALPLALVTPPQLKPVPYSRLFDRTLLSGTRGISSLRHEQCVVNPVEPETMFAKQPSFIVSKQYSHRS